MCLGAVIHKGSKHLWSTMYWHRGYSRESNGQSLPVLAVLSLELFTLTKAMVHLQINPVAVSLVTLLPLFLLILVLCVCVHAWVCIQEIDVLQHIFGGEKTTLWGQFSPIFYVGSKAGTCPEICVARTFTCHAIYFPSPSFLFNDIKWLDLWLVVARIVQVLWKCLSYRWS